MLFTFHHVSIKTIVLSHTEIVDSHSHSTMYLLKLSQLEYIHEAYKHSHSTMYLLKPNVEYFDLYEEIFTFHHVSIKTLGTQCELYLPYVFTFHHVSIKTDTITAEL